MYVWVPLRSFKSTVISQQARTNWSEALISILASAAEATESNYTNVNCYVYR